MGVAFVGDPHGNWDVVNGRLLELMPTAAVIVGDMAGRGGPPYRPLRECLRPVLEAGIDVRWIPGNHDSDRAELLEATFGSMPDENISGRVVELDGVKVAGLGGVFRGRVWRPPAEPIFASRDEHLRTIKKCERYKGCLPVRHCSTIYPSDLLPLQLQHADVLVAHDAPSTYQHGDVHGWQVYDDLARSLGAKVIVHGHYHYPYARRNADGVLCIGLGLAEVTMLDTLIAAGERDGYITER